MEGWNAAQNWAVFVPLAAGLTAYYYWPREKQGSTTKAKSQPVAAPAPPPKAAKTATKSPKKNTAAASTTNKAAQPQASSDASKQSKKTVAKPEQAKPAQVAPRSDSDDEEATEGDAKDFAKRLTQARHGVDVKKADAKDSRVRTVKQSNAAEVSARPSNTKKEKGFSVEQASAQDVSGVADMLEPTAPGPSVLRITASEKPVRQRQEKTKKADQDSALSKKARQNERKREEQRLLREEDEKQRKMLEERQRRTAREARGEPAKNGLSAAKAPANSSWDAKPSLGATDGSASANNVALLDTFDVESTSSSNAGASTAATSTTDAAPANWKEELGSARDTVADAVQQSLDDSAWTTASSKKKQKKPKAADKGPEDSTLATIRQAPAPTPKAVPGVKPTGFQALKDEYEQRTDVDANDASNWDA